MFKDQLGIVSNKLKEALNNLKPFFLRQMGISINH